MTMTTRLRLMLVYVVIARWSKYLFVILLFFRIFILLMIINSLVEFSKRKRDSIPLSNPSPIHIHYPNNHGRKLRRACMMNHNV
jgi:hypothetical protein